ncbi:hypothetical protein ACHAXA_005344 [Cyclostephanos tholiformis]|uniref:tRNA(Phe) (4-demethylwyosine(37)-C(7)) aminocarboxypropyltransferase n=1 Tax=Cyclostephanos tholiformis TaxID=382380 RepID=A0ABD3R6L1_9STRA
MTTTTVVYVRRRDAKSIKSHLEYHSFLDRRFRMSSVVVVDDDDASIDNDAVEITRLEHHDNDNNSFNNDDYDDECINHRSSESSFSIQSSPSSRGNNNGDNGDITMKDCIAVPVTERCMESLLRRFYNHDDAKSKWLVHDREVVDGKSRSSVNSDWLAHHVRKIIGFGRYTCPFSTSMLGNNNKQRSAIHHTSDSNNGCKRALSSNNVPLTNVQHVLIEALTSWLQHLQCCNDDDTINTNHHIHHRRNIDIDTTRMESLVRKLSNRTCPRKLEIIGDDRTVVIPHRSFLVDDNEGIIKNEFRTKEVKTKQKNECSGEFCEFLVNVIRDQNINNYRDNDCDADATTARIIFYDMQSLLWKRVATNYQCSRVVRRGDIDPESGIRESGHRILWPIPKIDDEGLMRDCSCSNLGYVPTSTGIDSPGWITVTEHGIRQSYDLTRVMFSRGNVTEKRRFGLLCVREGENILDMYAGIGYYTLPALILGKARHVTACEWNEHACYALRYNLISNGVGEERATILEGDCRVTLKRLLLRDEASFDRISLGLLPSSEGGWTVAVSCLNQSIGGWLHVHGNVSTMERQQWTIWLCQSLTKVASIQRRPTRRNVCRIDGENDGCDATHTNEDNDNDYDDEWIAIVRHVEKVKSFAPMIDHIVADVFVGPRHSPKAPAKESGVFDSFGTFSYITHQSNIYPPSCALNEEGIFNQNWLRE